MGLLLFIILVVIVLAALLGAGSYSVRRYWSPAGSEVVETGGTTGAGAGMAAAIIALVVLILLFFGLTRWNWFGSAPTQPVVPQQTSQTSPAQLPSSGASASPVASPSK